MKLKKKSISEDTDATHINDSDLDKLSDFSRAIRCVGSSVSHVSWCSGVLPEKNQLRETESSDPLFSHVSCVGENVSVGRNRMQTEFED